MTKPGPRAQEGAHPGRAGESSESRARDFTRRTLNAGNWSMGARRAEMPDSNGEALQCGRWQELPDSGAGETNGGGGATAWGVGSQGNRWLCGCKDTKDSSQSWGMTPPPPTKQREEDPGRAPPPARSSPRQCSPLVQPSRPPGRGAGKAVCSRWAGA